MKQAINFLLDVISTGAGVYFALIALYVTERLLERLNDND